MSAVRALQRTADKEMDEAKVALRAAEKEVLEAEQTAVHKESSEAADAQRKARRKTMVTGEGSSESSGQFIALKSMRSQSMPIGRRRR